jgi:DNA-binding GntR family transcriptional regulator
MTELNAPARDLRTPPDIAKAIRTMIREGAFRPGDRLGTAALAAEFGVSRGPVREALRLLESRGLVEVERNRGAFVVDIEDGEILETLRIREVLFALLAERCATEASDAGTERMRVALNQLTALHRSATVTPQSFQRATFEVVIAMFAAAGGQRLATMIADLSEGPGITYGHLAMATRDMRAIELKAYEQLIKAIESRDAARAFSLARRMHARGVERARELQALTSQR